MHKYFGLLAIILATATPASFASAADVSHGCAAQNSSIHGETFYVDPAKGSMSNNGSAERPWRTLAEVLDEKNHLISTQSYSGNYRNGDRTLQNQNPSAPIKPGDVINLMSGDHGNVQIMGAINSEFISVQAAPGQAPVIRSLRINGASKWLFAGLKVQGAADGSTGSSPGPGLIDIGRSLWRGPSSDIIFTGGAISTTNDSRNWSDEDWVKKPFAAAFLTGATCVTIRNSHFFNIRDGIGIDGDRTLIVGNKFDNIGNDAIDIVASDVTIRGNVITNGRNSKSEPLHADGIQGWTKGGATNKNTMIDGNMIIKTGDPNVTYMQGISIFDGKWDGLTIVNNVVVTNHWHGIAVYGASNAKIVNNTVVAYDPTKQATWITVQNGKDGTPSQNVIVRNNITTQLKYAGTGVTVDHNIVAKSIGRNLRGASITLTTPGNHGDNNTINPNIYSTLLKVDHSKGAYDFRPKANSPAIGSGSPEFAPATDFIGRRRTGPIDIGAYAR